MASTTDILIQQGKICPYCQSETEYVQSSLIYGRDYGMIYLCKACEAWVGVHEGTNKAKGRLANAELREWKVKAHASFDKLWKRYLHQGIAKHKLRNGAYQWLAKQMGIERKDVHIGMFDIDECKKAIAICDNIDNYEDSIKFIDNNKPVIKINPQKIQNPQVRDWSSALESRIVRQEESKGQMLKWCADKNVNAVEIQPYQIRFYTATKKIDIFPQSSKYHNIVSNVRGYYKNLINFLDSEFRDQLTNQVQDETPISKAGMT